jgi:hypothetical protein
MQIPNDAENQTSMDDQLTVSPIEQKPEMVLTTVPGDVLEALPCDEPTLTSVVESVTDDSSSNTFNLSLRTSALSVQLQTKTAFSPLIAELTTKLECALIRVNETDDRLTNAIYRIGYLESQLAERDKLIAELRAAQ